MHATPPPPPPLRSSRRPIRQSCTFQSPPLSPLPPLLPLFPFWSSPSPLPLPSHSMFRQQQRAAQLCGQLQNLEPKTICRAEGGGGGGRAKCEAGFLANFEIVHLSWLTNPDTEWSELPKAPWSLTSGECVHTDSERARQEGEEVGLSLRIFSADSPRTSGENRNILTKNPPNTPCQSHFWVRTSFLAPSRRLSDQVGGLCFG